MARVSIPCTRSCRPLAVVSALLAVALCAPGVAHAQARATGKIVIFPASSILNVPKLVTGEPPGQAVVFESPAYGCLEIPRETILGVGGHNLLNLTNATITAYMGAGCQGIPAPTLILPPTNVSVPNTGIHIDFANSIRVAPPDAASAIFAAGLSLPVTFTNLPSGPNPISDAPLQFMPTPDGRIAADPNPGSGRCKPINPAVHNVYNASTTNWVYLWVDPPLPLTGGCNLPLAAIPPGYIQHLVLNPNGGYSVSSRAPSTPGATASVRAACRKHVRRTTSRRAKKLARVRAATCEKSLMWATSRSASARRP